MAGPSPAFLALLNAQMANAPQPTLDLGADTITPQGAKYAPAPATYQAPASQPWSPPANPLGAPPPTGSGVPNPPLDNKPIPLPPTGTYGKPEVAGPVNPANAPAAAAAPSGAPLPGPIDPDVKFTKVAQAGTPAREAPTRGPKQTEYLEASFMHPFDAANRIEERSVGAASREMEMHDEIANRALERQAAFERQAARRAQELQLLQQDYQNTIGELSRFKLDNNRAWNNASTLDKIGATLLVMLGSVGTGGDASKNVVLQSVMGTIQEDVEKQKLAYERGLDLAKGQQTAFGMAMQRYGSEDAAYHAAMAAGQEAVAAKVGSMNAYWKGTDAQNQADMIRANLLAGAERMRADGIKYIQPTAGGSKFRVSIRGQELPEAVTGKEANAMVIEHGVKPAERGDDKLLEGGIQASLQDRKAAAEAATKGKENSVVMPNGEVLYAPDAKTAGEARTKAQAVNNANDLVKEALEIRKGTAWRVWGTEDRARLEGIQKELTLSFKDRGGLGALSGPDMDLALGATGDITSQSGNADVKLRDFAKHTSGGLRSYVKTIQTAPPKTSGVMPSSFKPEGK